MDHHLFLLTPTTPKVHPQSTFFYIFKNLPLLLNIFLVCGASPPPLAPPPLVPLEVFSKILKQEKSKNWSTPFIYDIVITPNCVQGGQIWHICM